MTAKIDPLSIDFEHSRPLVVILGPTAVGKTEIALQVALELNAEIVSADSRLLYTGMDIGTAKPTPAEQALVPHHLIDVTYPDDIWSLAQYQSAAIQAIDAIHRRQRLPLLVGGTGQYIHAVTQGWQIPQAEPDIPLRQALEQWAAQIGPVALHQRLSSVDPQAAASIDPANVRRTIRALEVIFLTGRLFSAQRNRQPSSYHIMQIGIARPRPNLYQRVDARILQMIEAGFAAEVRSLLDQGYAPSLPTLSAIGYGEMAAYLQGKISLAEAIELMKRRTRVFVRRQANWFKPGDPAIHWYSAEDNPAWNIILAIRSWINSGA